MEKEKERLFRSNNNKSWKKWGPYISDRQWGTVREDYSKEGHVWSYINHDLARSYAYRWGEEGIAGFCDSDQVLCLAPAFWNGKDSILKERLFGLTNGEGNHGEDVKELYFHLDSSPTHSYCKFLYKYPQQAFPYLELVEKNKKGRLSPEYELLDTGIFEGNRYFDCYIEYAKEDVNDILMKITVYNRGPEPSTIHVLPHLWFRNFWKHNPRFTRPEIFSASTDCLQTSSSRNGTFFLYHKGGEQLFCENETNNERMYNRLNDSPFVKDGINNYIVNNEDTINPKKQGTKSAVWFEEEIKPGASAIFKIRLSKNQIENPWDEFDKIFTARKSETDQYYDELTPKKLSPEHKALLRSSVSGLLWTKQFYYFDVFKWLFGEPGETHPDRNHKRNYDWQHLTCRNIISMPDKWEYPWFAAWDLAFHATSFVHVDPDFAKQQLLVVLREYYMHPNGQIPAYEWNFSDVNPPVQAWAAMQVYNIEKKRTGKGDIKFLKKVFQKLLINFTWWINRKDVNGNNIFEGGFLGLDNIGVFNRSVHFPGEMQLEQADGTSWMGTFALDMMDIAIEIAMHDDSFEDTATKFFEHFVLIAESLNHHGLWNQEDRFFYDVLCIPGADPIPLRIQSIVGLAPLYAVSTISKKVLDRLKDFKKRITWFENYRKKNKKFWPNEERSKDGEALLSLVPRERLIDLLQRLLDENEFLSDGGIRALSKYHENNIYSVVVEGNTYSIQYDPGDSTSDFFGGNSNWRGPVWMPINFLIIQSIRKYGEFYDNSLLVEYPTGSGVKMNLVEVANALTKRVISLFEKDSDGKRRLYGKYSWFYQKPGNEHLLTFYEYFHGNDGRGLGASHQTGWTALVAELISEYGNKENGSVAETHAL